MISNSVHFSSSEMPRIGWFEHVTSVVTRAVTHTSSKWPFAILSRLGRKTNQSSFSLAYLGLMVALLQTSFWPSIAMPSVATRVYDRTRKHSLKAVSTTSATFYLIVNFLAGLQFPIQVCFSTTVCDPSSCWVFVFLLRPWALTHDPDLRT